MKRWVAVLALLFVGGFLASWFPWLKQWILWVALWLVAGFGIGWISDREIGTAIGNLAFWLGLVCTFLVGIGFAWHTGHNWWDYPLSIFFANTAYVVGCLLGAYNKH